MRMALAVILLLPFIIGWSLIYKSWPIISLSELYNVLSGTKWSPIHNQFGMFPFIAGSVITTILGVCLMVPICLSASIYISQFAPGWLFKILRSTIDVLAGLPSVIVGLWGVIIIVPEVADWARAFDAENTTGYCILAGAVTMTVSVMPLLMNMLLEQFESISIEFKESVLSLGTSHWQMIRDVMLKKLKPGIIAAFTLCTSKAFGETIAVLMVVGNVVQIPNGLFDAGYPLTALLANQYGEMMTIPKYDAILMFSALILFITVLVFNIIAHRFINYYKAKV